MKVTPTTLKILRYMVGKPFCTPAEIGGVIGTKTNKAQGLGRMGGRLAKKLVADDLAGDCSHLRGGFPAYRITLAGLEWLKANE